jgi:hypothetical protein
MARDDDLDLNFQGLPRRRIRVPGGSLCGDADAIHISAARGGIFCESRVRASGDFGEYRTN